MMAIALAFAAGILASEYAGVVVCLIAAIACASVALARLRSIPPATVLLISALFAVGAARHMVDREIAPTDLSRIGQPVTQLEGTVITDPERTGDRLDMVFLVDRALAPGGWRAATGKAMLRVYATGETSLPDLHYGTRACVAAVPYPPRDFTNPGSFSWRVYLARKGIHTCATVRGASLVRILDGSGGSPLTTAALAIKHQLSRSIERIIPRAEATVVSGMVLGTYSYLPPDILRAFTRTGTLHLLAASGYNCFLLLAVATPLLRLTRTSASSRPLVVISLIVLYTLITGAQPSMVRAAIMSSLVLLAGPLRRAASARNLFFVAGLMILAVNPADLFDVGFQLSFLAVWSLVVVGPLLKTILVNAGLIAGIAPRRKSGAASLARKAMAAAEATTLATIAVTLVTMPVVAHYFNYVSLVSIPANVAVEFGVLVVFVVGFAAPIVAHVQVLGWIVGLVGLWFTRAMLWVLTSLGSMRYSAASVVSPGVVEMIGYYLVLYAGLSFVRSKYADQ